MDRIINRVPTRVLQVLVQYTKNATLPENDAFKNSMRPQVGSCPQVV